MSFAILDDLERPPPLNGPKFPFLGKCGAQGDQKHYHTLPEEGSHLNSDEGTDEFRTFGAFSEPGK
jgi:hypothetical protein